ncbi:PREDICTED: transcription factor VIP1-like [Lupinus angustifolius]|uniref:transcription factor VIP1-like n=1 Tax=Lupinus angustifolius TaxID=3871 RepID=UPI00092E8F9E|nr:PREDICTED: transcription factor VIP1-like [Lupinus angustifolius]
MEGSVDQSGTYQRSGSAFDSPPPKQKPGIPPSQSDINIHPSTPYPKTLGSLSPPHRLHYSGGSSQSRSLTQFTTTPTSTTSYESDSLTGNMVVGESVVSTTHVPSHSVFINRWHALQVGHNISPHKGHRRSRSDSPLKISGVMQSSSSGEEMTDFQKHVQFGLKGEVKDAKNVDGYSVDEPMNNGEKKKEKEGKTSHLLKNKEDQHSSNTSIDDKKSQTIMELENDDFNTEELKKIMESDKHVEIASTDPKREKRLLANRQSAARSRERKTKYISDLENKVKTFEIETTTLSAKLTNLQKDHSELKRENSKYKLRLQAIEKLTQLKDALNQTLNDEVQRLRHVVAELGGEPHHSSCMARQLGINQQIFQFQHQESNQDIHFPHTQKDRQ